MSLVTEQAEALLDICRLVQYATSLGLTVTAGEAERTKEQQEIYVKTGRSKTMLSDHLRRLAWDFNFYKDGKYVCDKNNFTPEQQYEILRPVGQFWESLHLKNRWGGNFDKDWDRKDPWVDLPHFERHV